MTGALFSQAMKNIKNMRALSAINAFDTEGVKNFQKFIFSIRFIKLKVSIL
jgi:hypothetical protein